MAAAMITRMRGEMVMKSVVYILLVLTGATLMAQSVPPAPSSTIQSPTQRLRVQQDGTQIFYEAWDTGAIDTTGQFHNWTAAITGAGGSSTPSAGQEVLASGVTANAFAFLSSAAIFQPESPGFVETDHQWKFTFPIPAHSYQFWGMGVVAASPTLTTYCVNCFGFELTGTPARLYAVTWASSTRNNIPALSGASDLSAYIVDGNVHRYQTFMRGDTIYWVIDGITVAQILTGALGPDSNLLPITMGVGCDSSGCGSSTSGLSAAVYIGDTTKGDVIIADATHPQFGKNLDPCETAYRTGVVLNITASTLEIAGVAGKQTYVCYIQFALSAVADNIALVEGTGAVCVTGTAGMAGGATAATGWNLLANGSVTAGTMQNWAFKTATAGDSVCLLVSSAAQISGIIQYVQQ